MSGQADLERIAARARSTMTVVRRELEESTSHEAAVLFAIATQLELANALTMARMAREAGEL